jgi:tripartite-type tricarboxylate transporter receptor subunit TctC
MQRKYRRKESMKKNCRTTKPGNVVKKTLSVLLVGVLVCAGAFAAGSADAPQGGAAWPNKTVQIIVPFGAGGDTDFLARLLAEKLSAKSGGKFVVVNMGGNGGATGSRFVKDAAPDGNTILFHQIGIIINELSGATDYGLEAFEFVGIVGRSAGNVLTVKSQYGFKTLGDLIEYTKKHPGQLKFAANTGASTHATALTLRGYGAQFNIVDAGGSAERISALLGGHVDVVVNAYGTVKDYLATGELTGLALDSEVQPKALDIPIGSKQGYDIGCPYYFIMAFPKGTDSAIVKKLSSALEDIIANDKDYADKIFQSYLQEPVFYDANKGAEVMKAAYDRLSRLDFKK